MSKDNYTKAGDTVYEPDRSRRNSNKIVCVRTSYKLEPEERKEGKHRKCEVTLILVVRQPSYTHRPAFQVSGIFVRRTNESEVGRSILGTKVRRFERIGEAGLFDSLA